MQIKNAKEIKIGIKLNKNKKYLQKKLKLKRNLSKKWNNSLFVYEENVFIYLHFPISTIIFNNLKGLVYASFIV